MPFLVYGSGARFDVSKIPEFRALACRKERRYGQIPEKLQEFWGDVGEPHPGLGRKISMWTLNDTLPQVAKQRMGIKVQLSTYGIHPAAMWYICEHLGFKCPVKEVERYEKKVLDNVPQAALESSLNVAKWLMSLPNSISRVQAEFDKSTSNAIKHLQQEVQLLTEAVDDMVPLVMHAFEDKVEKLRVHAVWSILLFELKVSSAQLAEYSKPWPPVTELSA